MNKDNITLDKFQKLCKELFDQRVKHEEAKAAERIEAEKFDELKASVMAYLEENEMEKFHVEGHGLIYTVDRFTVPVPKAMDSKKEFGKYLQQKGIFWELMSVNSATLNSFFKTEMEAAVARGDHDFKIPGIGEPSHIRTLNIRKG